MADIESGYIQESAYVIFIEIFILGLGGLGALVLIAQEQYLPTLPSAFAVLYAAGLVATTIAMILIRIGFHGVEEKTLLKSKFAANAPAIGILQGMMHVITAVVGVVFTICIVALHDENETLFFSSLFTSRMLNFKHTISTKMFMVGVAGMIVTLYILFVILFATTRNALGDISECRVHAFAFTETVAILFLWVQYFREYVIEQVCSNGKPCSTEDILVVSGLDLTLFQLVNIVCFAHLIIDILAAKFISMFKKQHNIVFFLAYLTLRIIALGTIAMAYFLFVEHEIEALRWPNIIVASLAVVAFLIEILFVLFQNNPTGDNPSLKTSSQQRQLFTWPSEIKMGVRQNKLRRVTPYIPRTLKEE